MPYTAILHGGPKDGEEMLLPSPVYRLRVAKVNDTDVGVITSDTPLSMTVGSYERSSLPTTLWADTYPYYWQGWDK